MDETHDEELLRGLDLPAPPPHLEASIARRTGSSVRWRARRRRLVLAGGLGLAYAAGALTFAPFLGPREVPVSPPASDGPRPVTEREAAPRRVPADRTTLAAAFRARGDRLLSEAGDVEGALAAYVQHLELASADGLAGPVPEDTWLLAALRRPRR